MFSYRLILFGSKKNQFPYAVQVILIIDVDKAGSIIHLVNSTATISIHITGEEEKMRSFIVLKWEEACLASIPSIENTRNYVQVCY